LIIFLMLSAGLFSSMSYVRSITSTRKSLLFVNHEACLRLRVPLHRAPRDPFPHRHLYFSTTVSLFQRRMLLPHVGQNISLFNSLHSCKNLTPLLWSENKNDKKSLFGIPSGPTRLRPNYPFET
jgi:hypothetical protein